MTHDGNHACDDCPAKPVLDLRALRQAAEGDLWEASRAQRTDGHPKPWRVAIDIAKKCFVIAYVFGRDKLEAEHLAALIVAAVNALPALLDLAEAAARFNSGANDRCDVCNSQPELRHDPECAWMALDAVLAKFGGTNGKS